MVGAVHCCSFLGARRGAGLFTMNKIWGTIWAPRSCLAGVGQLFFSGKTRNAKRRKKKDAEIGGGAP
jgi:hypothetical protein